MEGFTHRISAAALQSRRLVRITGHGPTWRAEITPSGTAFLERLATGGADQRSSDTTANRNDSRPAIRARLNGNATQPAPPARQPKPRSLSPTDQLIADLIAAGGILRVPYWRKEGEPDYRQRVIAAQRFGKVPPGKRLVTDHVQGGELEIRLEDALPGTDIVAQAVPVPARLTRPHSVAARYREDTDNHQVSRAALPRSVRIVHAVVTEAERRGHKVANPRSPVRDRSARDSAKELVPHVVITVGNHAYSLNMERPQVVETR